jgi:hypothetical protein
MEINGQQCYDKQEEKRMRNGSPMAGVPKITKPRSISIMSGSIDPGAKQAGSDLLAKLSCCQRQAQTSKQQHLQFLRINCVASESMNLCTIFSMMLISNF